MFFLIGSIILTSWLTLSFKLLERKNIAVFPSIVFNYISCVITGSVLNGKFPLRSEIIHAAWFPWALLMGCLFIGLFNIIGYTTQKLGVSTVSVANKLSVVIPFLFSIVFYHEAITWMKWVGVAVALVSVVLVSYQPTPEHHTAKSMWLLPAIIFAGSGLLDTLIKFTERNYLDSSNQNDFLITAFATAAAIGICLLVFKYIKGHHQFDARSIAAGIGIGVPNYFSIWCLVMVLKKYPQNSTAIFPINNMGIVLFSAVMAWLIFKEKMSVVNWTGIALSLLAIALITFG